MDIILDSIRNIIFADVLISLVEMIMPDSGRKKYFNFVSGLVLAVILIEPFTNIKNIETSFRNYSFAQTRSIEGEKLNREAINIENMQYAIFRNTVGQNIEASILAYVKEEFDVVGTRVKISFIEKDIKSFFDDTSKNLKIGVIVREVQIFCTMTKVKPEALKKYINSNFGIDVSRIKISPKGED